MWWVGEVEGDPAYAEVVTPLLIEILCPQPGALYIDLGCGDGRVAEADALSGSPIIGIDVNEHLARRAGPAVIVADVPDIPVRSKSADGCFLVLSLEHIVDHRSVFAETARVTKAGGVLALVMNHPIWTAPDSTPITDSDGETLWRPGEYFSAGSSEYPADDSYVTFHHRTMAALLNAASTAGWSLDHMIERPHHDLDEQAGIPRLLACRWRLLP